MAGETKAASAGGFHFADRMLFASIGHALCCSAIARGQWVHLKLGLVMNRNILDRASYFIRGIEVSTETTALLHAFWSVSRVLYSGEASCHLEFCAISLISVAQTGGQAT